MALQDVPRCQHIKVNGVQCASPALRRKARCFFHEHAHFERKFAASQLTGNGNSQLGFGFPLLEDANSIQVAIMKTIQMLASGQLDTRAAGLMLYGLQIASSNLRYAKFEPEKPTDVVVDEDTIDLTRLEGRQWNAHDFTESDLTAGETLAAPQPETAPALAIGADPLAARGEAASALAATDAIPATDNVSLPTSDDLAADRARRRELKRKAPQRFQDFGPPDSLAKVLLEHMGIDWRESEARLRAQNDTGS